MDSQHIIKELIDEIRSERKLTQEWIDLLNYSEQFSSRQLQVIKKHFGYREINKVIDEWREENNKQGKIT